MPAITTNDLKNGITLQIDNNLFTVVDFQHVKPGKGGAFAGLAIGLTLVFAILAGGPMTGASLNPARTFGPALVTCSFTDPMTYLIYFVGPLLGSALAVGVFRFLNRQEMVVPPVVVRKTVTRK